MSTVITCLLTVIQFYFYYQSDVKKIESGLERIKNVNIESLTQSVWFLNEKQIDLQLEGILEIPGVEYVEIITMDDEHFKKGNPQSQ